MKKAEEVQKKIDDGTLTGALAGVPVAVKDNMCTEGILTTCSSKILSNFRRAAAGRPARHMIFVPWIFGFSVGGSFGRGTHGKLVHIGLSYKKCGGLRRRYGDHSVP